VRPILSSASARSFLPRFKNPGLLPGFSLSLGFTLVYLSLIVLIPLGFVIVKGAGLGFDGLAKIIADPRVLASLRLSFGMAFAAAVINAVFGVIVAWVLVRYKFPGRAIVDAAVDLPFALPTAVAGIALATLYSPRGLVGSFLGQFGLKVAFTPLGVGVALVFIGLPFVVRTVQPVIAELDREIEEAAATLGASRFTTITRIILPPLIPSILTGFTLAFARAIGEYGSVIFIAGNMPGLSEITPLLIVIKLEAFDYVGATGLALVMLAASFVLLLLVNLIQAWTQRRFGHV
jgi:sulfate transport system permease protein